nr:hypothetical protein [Streptomyces olivoreticuli]
MCRRLSGRTGFPGRVVLAEDHFLLRDGLIRLLGAFGHEIVAAVDNGSDLLTSLTGLRPKPGLHPDEGDNRRVLAVLAYLER